MVRGLDIRVVRVLCCLACAAAQQAGEPVVLNVEYDVPSVSADAASAMLRHSAALEAQLRASNPNVRDVRDFSFSAFGQSGDDVPPEGAEIVLHVASPVVGTAQAAKLTSGALSQLASLSAVSQKQHSQELRALRGAKLLLQRSSGFASDDARPKGSTASGPTIAATARVAGSGGRLAELSSEVAAGGSVAKNALEQLLALAADPSARDAVASSAAPQAAATLLQRPSTDETNRGLAGSLLTFLSGMPIAAELSNVVTGAGEHVEVVLPRPSRVYGPDFVAMQLAAGVPPSATM